MRNSTWLNVNIPPKGTHFTSRSPSTLVDSLALFINQSSHYLRLITNSPLWSLYNSKSMLSNVPTVNILAGGRLWEPRKGKKGKSKPKSHQGRVSAEWVAQGFCSPTPVALLWETLSLHASPHCLQLFWADAPCFLTVGISRVSILSSVPCSQLHALSFPVGLLLRWPFFKIRKLTRLRSEPGHPDCNEMPMNTHQSCLCLLSLRKCLI